MGEWGVTVEGLEEASVRVSVVELVSMVLADIVVVMLASAAKMARVDAGWSAAGKECTVIVAGWAALTLKRGSSVVF
jgi:hypothetical protein